METLFLLTITATIGLAPQRPLIHTLTYSAPTLLEPDFTHSIGAAIEQVIAAMRYEHRHIGYSLLSVSVTKLS